MMTSGTTLQKAFAVITKATQEDVNKNYQKALDLYTQGIDFFLQAIQSEATSENVKRSIRVKCAQYLDRAEEIKTVLKTNIYKAAEILTKATEEDRKGNYKEAMRLYELGVADFMHVMKYYVLSESSKELIRAKSKLYADRAEEIKEAIGTFDLKAIGSIIRAIDEDRDLNYEKALTWYEEGDEYLLLAKKWQMRGEKEMEKMEVKRLYYLNRAEKIKEFIPKDNKIISNGKRDLQKKIEELNLENVYLCKIPQITWSDVAGLDAAKDALNESVILTIKCSNLFPNNKKISWKGILLFGPPGTGKSTLGTALLTEVGSSSSYYICILYLNQLKDFNKSGQVVKALFETAHLKKLSIIFVDEVDLLCMSSSDEESELTRCKRTEFLLQIQALENNNSNEFLLVGATNKPWMLDEALLQHFQTRIYTPLPDEHTRFVMFKLYLGKSPSLLTEDDLKTLAKMTEGYSGKDIHNVVNDALIQTACKVQTATHFKPLSGPCPKDPTKTVNDLLTPCCPDDQGAIEMSFWDMDCDKLFRSPVTMSAMLKSLTILKPKVVTAEDLAKLQKFKEDCERKG